MVYCQIEFKETINPNEMEIKDELVLQGMNQAAADEIEYNTMGAFQTSDCNTHEYYIVKWTGNAYTPSQRGLVVRAKYFCISHARCHRFRTAVSKS